MRHMRRTRRVRPPTQWVVDSNYNVATNTVAGVAKIQTNLVQATAAASALAVPNIARMTVLRIRGQFFVTATTLATDYHLGVIVLNDVADAIVAAQIPNPATANNADAAWLWLHHGGCVAGAAVSRPSMNDLEVPMGTNLDITVKRVLRPNQTLVLVASSTTDAVTITTFIRTLISRVA